MNQIDASFYLRQGNFELDAAFKIPGQGVTALFGPSGCGKTTVLRCMAGLNRIDNGHLRLNGKVWQDGPLNLPPHKRAVGYVFQEANLFAHLSVRDNLTFGQKRSSKANGGVSLKFDEVVDLLGLPHLLDRAPQRLSGGERQRVAIGRALLSHPEILLMDEPLAALDRFSKKEIIPYLESLHRALSIPVVYVSHDITEVERLADQMILMDRGKVIAQGPLDLLLTDPNLPFAKEPEAASVLMGEVTHYDADYGLCHFQAGDSTFYIPSPTAPKSGKQRLRILASDVGLTRGKPEDLQDMSILNTQAATIIHMEPRGDFEHSVFLRLGTSDKGPTLLARITRKSWEHLGLDVGTEVTTLIKSMAIVDHM